MQLAITEDNIKAIISPGGVHNHTRGASGYKSCIPLHACHDAHFPSRAVKVEERAHSPLLLPVATDVAVRGHPGQHWTGGQRDCGGWAAFYKY